MQGDQPVVVGFRSETPTEGNSNRGNRERLVGAVSWEWWSPPAGSPHQCCIQNTKKRISSARAAWPCGCQGGFPSSLPCAQHRINLHPLTWPEGFWAPKEPNMAHGPSSELTAQELHQLLAGPAPTRTEHTLSVVGIQIDVDCS